MYLNDCRFSQVYIDARQADARGEQPRSDSAESAGFKIVVAWLPLAAIVLVMVALGLWASA